MARRMRRPETTTLQISDGDWLLVKKHLTTGETRAHFARIAKPLTAGQSLTVEAAEVGLSTVISYLLDWSIKDAEDRPVIIRGKSIGELTAALDNLDPDSFQEIRQAIEAHVERMEQERAAEKNVPAGESKSSPISPSVAA